MTEEMEGQMSFADLGLWFGRTSPEPCPQTTEKTSAQSSRKSSVLPNRMPMCLDLRNRGLMQVASWDMDGLLLGEYTMHSFGECPKDVVESHLSQILQGGATEILFERNSLQGHPSESIGEGQGTPRPSADGVGEAISFQDRCGCEGGGKGVLVQRDRTGSLSTVNNQYVIS